MSPSNTIEKDHDFVWLEILWVEVSGRGIKWMYQATKVLRGEMHTTLFEILTSNCLGTGGKGFYSKYGILQKSYFLSLS